MTLMGTMVAPSREMRGNASKQNGPPKGGPDAQSLGVSTTFALYSDQPQSGSEAQKASNPMWQIVFLDAAVRRG